MSKNPTLKFVLSGLKSRFSHSSGSLRDMFREWDTDKSGDVDAGELRAALHGLGFTAVSPQDAEALVANIDIGGDGRVQYEDFVRLLCPPKGETRAVTLSEADVQRINARVHPAELNLPGRVFFLGGRATKRVVGPGEAAALRHSSLGDVATGVASDALRESVSARRDEAEAAIRRAFYSDLLGASSGSASGSGSTMAVSEAEEGAAAQEAGLSSLRGVTTGGAAAPGGAPAAPRSARRTTARREVTVELASLPPAVQANVLMSKGLLPRYEFDASAVPPPTAPWAPEPELHAGALTMEQRIQAAHASNAAGREYAARLAAAGGAGGAGGGSPHHPPPAPPGAVHVSTLRAEEEREAAAAAARAALPTHVSLPVSPLARTARASARAPRGVPPLQLPGTERGALAPSSTVDLAHPLSYLTALGSSALAPAPALLGTLVAGVPGGSGSGSGSGSGEHGAPPPNTLDRSLHASARLPPRGEGLAGPLSATGARYSHVAVAPDGGRDTVVVGHLQTRGKGVESITASGGGAAQLAAGPFFSSVVQRDLDRRIGRLRLSAVDVLEIPGSGRATAPHISAPQLQPPPFSPLAPRSAGAGSAGGSGSGSDGFGSFGSSGIMRANFTAPAASAFSPPPAASSSGGDGKSRAERYEARRQDFFAGSGRDASAPPSPPRASAAAPGGTLADRLSSSRHARESRMSSVLGLPASPAPLPSCSAAGSSGRAPPPADADAAAPGTGRVLARALRHEGERTSYLLSPPPGLRAECTPEHPSWHYASAARLAQTGAVVPEQAFGRLAGVDKVHSGRSERREREERERRQHAHDFEFEQTDIASRIARKREERSVYKAGVTARRQGQEASLCLPFPVGEVQL